MGECRKAKRVLVPSTTQNPTTVKRRAGEISSANGRHSAWRAWIDVCRSDECADVLMRSKQTRIGSKSEAEMERSPKTSFILALAECDE